MIKYITYSRKDIFLDLRTDIIKYYFDMYFNKGHNCFAVSMPFPKAHPGMGLCGGRLFR